MFEKIGHWFIVTLIDIINFLAFIVEVLRYMLSFFKQRQISMMVLLRQILFTGYEALSLISIIAVAIGGLIIIEVSTILGNFGQSEILYPILISTVIRELSGLMTAFIIIARSGSAISTELGNMVVNNEIELLQSIGISPLSYLVVPRLVGVVVSMACLSVYFNLVAIIGGWLFSSFFASIPFSVFSNHLLTEMRIADILQSIVKSIVFGFCIAIFSCYQGLSVVRASTEVPQKTIKAVVYSFASVICIDVIITVLFSNYS